jgi:predicted dehydrogenase
MKIGIIGLGFMGAMHLSAFSKLKDVEVAAVCARNPRSLSGDLRHVGGNLKLEAAVHDFSQVRKYTDWQELVRDPTLDAVDICLPTDAHAGVSLAAFAAGKHVLCEKPMALTLAECERMIAAAASHQRIFMVGQVLRFWPEYRYLESFVNRNRPSVVSATFSRRAATPDWSPWLMDESRSGGAILDLLIHDIDQALWLFGLPEEVSATALNGGDSLAAVLSYPGDLQVRIEGGWFGPETSFSMTFAVRTPERELDLTSEGLRLNNGPVELPPAADAYETELAYFVDCCRMNRQPELCLPQDSAQAVELALLLKQSRSEEGKPLKCKIRKT